MTSLGCCFPSGAKTDELHRRGGHTAQPAFDGAIASFSESYADQNQRDHEWLRTAEAEGRIALQSGL
jgi:hypothetical protein